jgi:transcriptional regulator with GAF, ATPase, and Fis domain
MRRLREAVEAENRALLSRLGQPQRGDVIVGGDAGLRPVLQRVVLVARSDVPVLILGETGTGKEVIARAIHGRSPRAAGPMIRVNCGAIPTELVDSELFGHERGSFTGATATRSGWFERADGGTLFLDEVGELPLAAQVRLLRILQDGTFERVGGTKPLVVDVRVVAATHRDLPALVREGRFREDLWYRLCVFPIHLPALRERPEDISALATHFALRAARRLGLAPALPTPSDLALLAAYPWPGNVRELISVVERAAILGDGRRLEVEKAIGTTALGAPARAAAAGGEAPATPSQPAPARDEASLDAAMVRHIEAALRESLGRIEGPFGAARRLGVNPHTLRARMRRLGVEWRRFRG